MPVKIGGKDYIIEFQDSNLSLKGWTNPRYDGSGGEALFYNAYQGPEQDAKFLGPIKNLNLSPTHVTVQPYFISASGVRASMPLRNITHSSDRYWYNEWPPQEVDVSSILTDSSPPTVANGRILQQFQNFIGEEQEYFTTPVVDYEGDKAYGKTPLIENTTTAIFIGTTIIGDEEHELWPSPGPDFSYLVLDRIIVFNIDDDSFFIIENKEENTETFGSIVKTTFPWASTFSIKLLDQQQSHQLKEKHGAHWNRGAWSTCATFTPNQASKSTIKHDYATLQDEYFVLDSNFPSSPKYYNIPKSKYGDVVYAEPGSWAPFHQKGTGDVYYDNGDPTTFTNKYDTRVGGGLNQNMSGTGNPKDGLTTDQYMKANHIANGANDYPDYWANSASFAASYWWDPTWKIEGDFIINEKNPSVNWWFMEGGQSSIKQVSASKAARSGSIKHFLESVYNRPSPELYVKIFNKAKDIDTTFRNAFLLEKKDTIGVNVTKPLSTFGAIPWCPATRVGVKGSYKEGIYWDEGFPTVGIPAAYTPYFKKFELQYGIVSRSGHYHPTIYSGNPAGTPASPKIYQTTAGSGIDVWDKIWYGTNNRYFSNRGFDPDDAENASNSPLLEEWKICKMEDKPNYILTDLNKNIELPNTFGKKGFVVLPDNLSPEIKNNIDYFLKKAQLIDIGPKRKDKTLKKGGGKGFVKFKKKSKWWKPKLGY